MATIPRLNKTILPPSADPSAISRAGGLARAVSDVAGVATGVTQKFKDAKDASFVNETSAQYEREVDDFFQQSKVDFAGDPEAGKDSFTKFMNDRAAELSQGGSGAAQNVFSGVRRDIENKYLGKYGDFSRTQTVKNFGTSFDNSIRDTSVVAFREGQAGGDLQDSLNTVDASLLAGSTFLNEGDLAALGQEAKGAIAQEYVQGLIENNPAEAKRRLVSGEFDDKLTSDQLQSLGNVSEAAQTDLENQIKKEVVQADNEIASDIGLQIATSQSLADVVKAEEAISNSDLGVIKTNALKAKVFAKREKLEKETKLITDGAQFASGEVALNPANADDKKAYNAFYESLLPTLETLPPAEQSIAKATIIDNARSVPDVVKGELSLAARSQNAEEITNAADFIDRVTAINPHLIGDLGSEGELARIQMVNQRIEAGIPPKQAIEATDRILDPKNAPTEDVVQSELSTIKKTFDYRKEAKDNFDTLFTFAPREEGPFVTPELDGLTARYRVAFEDHYRITRDKDVSAEYANKVVRGQYGNSTVNGFKQIMQYNPEQYYAIQGENNKWMRKQMLDDAIEQTKGDLSPPTKKELEKNLRLVVDPRVTPRSANAGAPLYKLFLIKDDAPVDLLNGQFFKFDPDKRKKQLIENAKK